MDISWHDFFTTAASLIGAAAGLWAFFSTRKERQRKHPAVKWGYKKPQSIPFPPRTIISKILADRDDADLYISEVTICRGYKLNELKVIENDGAVEKFEIGECYGRTWTGMSRAGRFVVTGPESSAPLRITSTVVDKARSSIRSSFTSEI